MAVQTLKEPVPRVSTPEPLPGRKNVEVEAKEAKEELTDKPPEFDFGAQTDFYIDRPV
jgi:hypothetical protein